VGNSDIASGSYIDVTGYGGSLLAFKTWNSTGSAPVLVEPIATDNVSGRFRSPMSFVLKATDSYSRILVGTFYSVAGQELLTRTSPAMSTVSMSIDTTAKTLGRLFTERSGHASDEYIFADAYEFRGMLYGGPVEVTPGSNDALEASVSTTYRPIAGSPRIYPGPVVLSSSHGILQPATATGAYGQVTLEKQDSTGASASSYVADFTGANFGRIFVRWNTDSLPNADLTIEVAPLYYVMGSATPRVSNILVNRLTATSSVEAVYHLDVEPGLFLVSISSGVEGVMYYWSLASF